MEEKIVITFDDDGNPFIEAFGMKGELCLKKTEWLRKSLGKDKRVERKTDFYNGVAQQPAYLKSSR